MVQGQLIVRSRWVVRQFRDKAEEDVYAGCPGGEAIRCLLAIAVFEEMEIIPGDFSVAFMHTPMTYEEYVEAPPEWGIDADSCWRLERALNGLRKAAQLFQKYLIGLLTEKMGFLSFSGLPTLLRHQEQKVRVAIHVDDPLSTGPGDGVRQMYKSLGTWLVVKIGEAFSPTIPARYLGGQYWRVQDTIIEAAAEGYIDSMVKAGSCEKARRVATPGVSMPKKMSKEDEALLTKKQHRQFRSIVGKGQFLAPKRPDVLYPLKECSRRLATPRVYDLTAAKRICRYLKGTKEVKLYLRVGPDASRLRGRSDTDWAGCVETRRSTSSGQIFWGDFLLMAYSRQQSIVARSSPEAEYYGITALASEMMYVQAVMKFLGYQLKMEAESDASSAIALASRCGLSRIRHIDIQYLWVQWLIENHKLFLKKVEGQANSADMGTKHLDAATLQRHMWTVGLRGPHGSAAANGADLSTLLQAMPVSAIVQFLLRGSGVVGR